MDSWRGIAAPVKLTDFFTEYAVLRAEAEVQLERALGVGQVCGYEIDVFLELHGFDQSGFSPDQLVTIKRIHNAAKTCRCARLKDSAREKGHGW